MTAGTSAGHHAGFFFGPGLHRVFLRQRAAGGGLVTHGLNLLRAIQRTLRGINLCCPSGVTHRILILKRVSLISHDAISAARFSNSTNNTHQQNRQNTGPNHPQTSMKPNIVTGHPEWNRFLPPFVIPKIIEFENLFLNLLLTLFKTVADPFDDFQMTFGRSATNFPKTKPFVPTSY